MKTIINYRPQSTIEEFADQHDLVMVVTERASAYVSPNQSDRFYAKFTGGEIKGNGVLSSVFGNGSTPEEAIENYAKHISEKTLVFDARSIRRKEINVPVLI